MRLPHPVYKGVDRGWCPGWWGGFMERERGGGDDEVEHEVDGEEVREEARREDVAEDLGQIETSG